MEEFDIKMELDCRGLKCPLPVIKTRKAIKELNSGALLRMISSDPGSINDIRAWAKRTGNKLLGEEHKQGEFVFIIAKN